MYTGMSCWSDFKISFYVEVVFTLLYKNRDFTKQARKPCLFINSKLDPLDFSVLNNCHFPVWILEKFNRVQSSGE